MEIKANINVSPEEVLLHLKPEFILDYLKKNHPTFCKEQIEDSKEYYSIDQWFKRRGVGEDGNEYYFFARVNSQYYLHLLNLKSGRTNSWNGQPMKISDHNGILVSEFEKTVGAGKFYPVSWSDTCE